MSYLEPAEVTEPFAGVAGGWFSLKICSVDIVGGMPPLFLMVPEMLLAGDLTEVDLSFIS